ncbi:MAG: efflux RND transporter permease subunit, partial [Deltaproteobacteria bacterium]|nr:efflux RND transporter permease subunit [Deltaproteobacteria bacterium]
AVFAGSLLFIPLIGTEFFPKSDEGQLRINFRLPVGTRIEETMRTMEQIEQLVIADVPELRAMYARAGSGKGRGVIFGGRHAGPHTGFISASLVDKADRSRSPDQIARALRPKLSRIPGTVVAINPGGLVSRLITFGAEEPIDIEIQGHDLATASRVAREMADWLRGVRGVADVQVSREEGLPELRAYIQHHRVAALGLTVSRVADTVKAALQGIEASIFIDPSTGREHKIRVRLREEDRQRVDDLRLINLPMKNGHPVPLSSVAELVHTASPTQIERKYQRRIVHITADTSGRDLGSIAQEIEQYLASYTVPKDFSVNLGGARQEQQDAFRNLALALGLAVVLVYMVLASQYRSLLHPLVVMFSVPLGVTGVIWALLLTETTLSVISFIGVIMMVGIVVSNAILLVDYTNVLREEHGLPLHQAVVTAGRTRLRPILMTTLTTILALSPLAMGIGEGSEANQPMAIAVIGGLAVSTLTLEERVRRGRPGPAGSPSADAPQP